MADPECLSSERITTEAYIRARSRQLFRLILSPQRSNHDADNPGKRTPITFDARTLQADLSLSKTSHIRVHAYDRPNCNFQRCNNLHPFGSLNTLGILIHESDVRPEG